MDASALLRQEMAAGQKVLLVGPPGIGKTASILAAAQDTGYKTSIETKEGLQSTVLRASLMERVDLTGCMVPDAKMGVTRQLPLSLINTLQKTAEKVLLFFDDMGQAPIDVQASLMRLFDTHFLPKNVLIWGATNRPGDKSGVSSLCEPLRSRFDAAYIMPVPGSQDKPDGGVPLCSWADWCETWIDWASNNNAPSEIIAWHKSTAGKSLYAWSPQADPSIRMADFRSWGSMITRWNKGLRSLQYVSAVLGKAVAAEFLSFCALKDKLPTPDEVWHNPTTASVPTESSAKWLISCVLAQQVTTTVLGEFITYLNRMNDRVMMAFAARFAFKRKEIGGKLPSTPEWKKWFQENGEIFDIS